VEGERDMIMKRNEVEKQFLGGGKEYSKIGRKILTVITNE